MPSVFDCPGANSLVYNTFKGQNVSFINVYNTLKDYSNDKIHILVEESEQNKLFQVNSIKIGSNGIILQSQHRPHILQTRKELNINFNDFHFKDKNNTWRNANEISDDEEIEYSDFSLTSIIRDYKECLVKNLYICNIARSDYKEIPVRKLIYDNKNDIIILFG